MEQFKLKPWIISLVVVVVIVVIFVLVGGVERSASPDGSEGEDVAGTAGEAVAPGTSFVTDDGEVVTQEGKPVELDVRPGSPQAPQQSDPISEEALPKEAVKLTISASGISPGSFEVRSGTAVTLSVTSGDTQTHIFKFNDSSLSAVAIGVGPGETRAIAFNAPKKGDYSFFCDVPGHAGRGETGTMVVK